MTLSDPRGRILTLTDPHTAAKKGHCDVGALSGGVWSVTFFKLGTGDIFIDGN